MHKTPDCIELGIASKLTKLLWFCLFLGSL